MAAGSAFAMLGQILRQVAGLVDGERELARVQEKIGQSEEPHWRQFMNAWQPDATTS